MSYTASAPFSRPSPALYTQIPLDKIGVSIPGIICAVQDSRAPRMWIPRSGWSSPGLLSHLKTNDRDLPLGRQHSLVAERLCRSG